LLVRARLRVPFRARLREALFRAALFRAAPFRPARFRAAPFRAAPFLDPRFRAVPPEDRFRADELDERFLAAPPAVRFRDDDPRAFRLRVAAAFRADAERADLGRDAEARPPARPPFRAGPLFVFLPRPEPLFRPPPDILFSVAHARRSASFFGTPRLS
jgi:hypothetical protein